MGSCGVKSDTKEVKKRLRAAANRGRKRHNLATAHQTRALGLVYLWAQNERAPDPPNCGTSVTKHYVAGHIVSVGSPSGSHGE